MPPPTPRAAAVEEEFRRLLAENDLPEPDDVQHDPGEVVFLFRDRKVAVVVDYEPEDSCEPEDSAEPDDSGEPDGPGEPDDSGEPDGPGDRDAAADAPP
jgi:hypothetical protein